MLLEEGGGQRCGLGVAVSGWMTVTSVEAGCRSLRSHA